MSTVLFALGAVAVFEGLVLTLLPHRLEELLERLSAFPIEARRLTGLLAMVAGVGLVALARASGF